MSADRIATLFHENFTAYGELGASVCVWREGREVLSLAGGFRDRARTLPWTDETPVLFWSATKGLAAACLLHACQEHAISPLRLVAEVWPDFSQAGKERVTIAELLSHQAGLPALTPTVDVLDHAAVAAALAAETPHWPPGIGHGYHPRTFGYLVDELLRRITGTALREYWRDQIAEPLGLDVWIGLPPEREAAAVFPAKTAPPKGDPFYTAFLTPDSLTARAFATPRGLHSVASMNSPEARAASLGAFGGIGTARGLAKFYALLAGGGEWAGRRFFQPATLDWMTTTLTQGLDRVLLAETAFSAGFMRDPADARGAKRRTHFGPSPRAFGHPGAGGSHAFADPDTGLAFAYVMNQMEPGVFPGPKCLRLVAALYGD
ncbi:MAG: beta-lactamase family protein [Chthoniobacter sp.]|nr:beta-lactamase family protein [Chthoniobacter sp.]